MGHDEHFLRRLDRVSDDHVELSLTLYRDEELLREVLSRADLPPGAERLAISLNDPTGGPFVIVTRSGNFVTCLGEGMRVGSDMVVLTRPRLDAAISKVERMRERVARITALSRDGHDGTAQRLFKKLADEGLRFCREDAETLIDVWPLVGRHAGLDFTQLVRSLSRTVEDVARLRFDKLLPPERKMVHHFGRVVWSASHLIVLTAERESATFFDEIDAAHEIDTHGILWCALFRLTTQTHSMRVLWSIGQRRKRALDTLREMRGIEDIEATLMRELGLGVVAIGTPKVRAEAIKAMTRKSDATLRPGADKREEALHELRGYAGQCGDMARAVLASEETCDAQYVDYGRRVAAVLVSGGLAKNVTPEIRNGITDDVARAVLPCLPHTWYTHESMTHMAMAVPWLARAKPAELFLPRAFLERIPRTDLKDVEILAKGFAEAQRLNRLATVRNQGPKVGRNDACTCGSNKKYKRCCGK